jgi:uncharacterized protein YjiS (DUF1127 family)
MRGDCQQMRIAWHNDHILTLDHAYRQYQQLTEACAHLGTLETDSVEDRPA